MIRSSLLAVITLIGMITVSPVQAGGNSRGRTVVVLRHRPLATGVAPIGFTQPRPVRQIYTRSGSNVYRASIANGQRRTVRYYPAWSPLSFSIARARAAAGYGRQYYSNTPYFGNNGYGIPGYSHGYGSAVRGGSCRPNGYVGGLHNIQNSVIQIPRGSCQDSR